jgi:sulfur carrier protein
MGSGNGRPPRDTPADGAILPRLEPGAQGDDNAGMDATPFTIVLNGSPRQVPAGCSVAGLLREAGHGERRVAVEVNGAIVPRSAHEARALAAGDRVEIVQALGGG